MVLTNPAISVRRRSHRRPEVMVDRRAQNPQRRPRWHNVNRPFSIERRGLDWRDRDCCGPAVLIPGLIRARGTAVREQERAGNDRREHNLFLVHACRIHTAVAAGPHGSDELGRIRTAGGRRPGPACGMLRSTVIEEPGGRPGCGSRVQGGPATVTGRCGREPERRWSLRRCGAA